MGGFLLLGQKRIRDHGLKIGVMETGPRNSITDIEGVAVGHCTILSDHVRTGVTAVIPHEGNLFREKLPASSHVINGFGKSTGLLQIEELGTIETPILLTNTFGVGSCINGLIRYMLEDNPDIGISTGTVNPVVLECNDGYLNDIRGMHVRQEHVMEALSNARRDFLEGSVGGGTGMSCYQLKGGIGTSSRVLHFAGHDCRYSLGVLVQSNFGKIGDFVCKGKKFTDYVPGFSTNGNDAKVQGSIIVVIGTDLPLNGRQLKRVCKRASVGINRTGSFIENGSGEIAIAFSTAQRIPHYPGILSLPFSVLSEDLIDNVFRAVAEAVEEAILNSMICADPMYGRAGNYRASLQNWIERLV
ncbi:MAG: P1 family peptidase [Synergistales bacterium]|nr:P1 family peptidase [Synergistales bacterium]